MRSKKPPPPKPGSRVGVRQRRRAFAREYARTGNASAAARSAGYSPRTAASQGYDLLRDPQVAAMVEEERQKRAELFAVDERWILERVAAIAGADRREITEVIEGRLVVHDSATWSREAEQCVRAIRARVARKRGRPGKAEGEEEGDEVLEIAVTMEPKLEALRLAAEIVGALKPRGIDLTSGGKPLMRGEPITVEEAEEILREARS